ncbi:hypothetical protein AMECASPLE_002850 [Ameca splendens]|uniref:Uncharacterized protein n=1 Tax=Ameca splendens TaxID=208324 RepID=A0ABV0YWG2_9TELE
MRANKNIRVILRDRKLLFAHLQATLEVINNTVAERELFSGTNLRLMQKRMKKHRVNISLWWEILEIKMQSDLLFLENNNHLLKQTLTLCKCLLQMKIKFGRVEETRCLPFELSFGFKNSCLIKLLDLLLFSRV